MARSSKRNVAYFHDPDVGSYSYGPSHLMKPLRMRITHELCNAYDLLTMMDVQRAERSSAEAMCAFHTDEYIEFLSKVTPETVEDLTFNGNRFGMSQNWDNPAFEGVFEFCSLSAGGSVAAAKTLSSGSAEIAINWAGGLHHAKKAEASGFCYVNDIVLGILELLRVFPRVLYIDIDCHHGDGVEEAFYSSNRVMTCSFHKYGSYFPGTGQLKDRGVRDGFGYAVNVPFKDGLSNGTFHDMFDPIMDKIMEVFQPSAVVLQCGSDSLAGDRLGCFNLTMQGHAHCVQHMRKFDVPLMLLGGGGYTVKNAARAWTYETACALGVEQDLDLRLPYNEFFEWFAPRYRLEVAETNLEDLNPKDGAHKQILQQVLQNLSELKTAPSVGLQDVPRESIGDHLGLTRSETTEIDDLDRRLAQYSRFVYETQDPEPSDRGSEDEESDSGSVASRRRSRRTRNSRKSKRMSILTNEWEELPHMDLYDPHEAVNGARPKRRYFDSGLTWNPKQRMVIVNGYDGSLSVSEVMERGGRRIRTDDGMDIDE